MSENLPESPPDKADNVSGDHGSVKKKSLQGPSITKHSKRGRKPSKVDMKAKLERSRQSARECRARKKLRYQYLEELVSSRERSVLALRKDLELCKSYCQELSKGNIPPTFEHFIEKEKAKRRERPRTSSSFSSWSSASPITDMDNEADSDDDSDLDDQTMKDTPTSETSEVLNESSSKS